ncbi:hypothetical protein ACH4SP_04895 [Streptomyces sp. NPDC021093]|uniref:hypothetical protein n=1 Tax=Streptomyces sp. NPDC021093 TaxID=3365112 RepID=UPI0037B88FBD
MDPISHPHLLHIAVAGAKFGRLSGLLAAARRQNREDLAAQVVALGEEHPPLHRTTGLPGGWTDPVMREFNRLATRYQRVPCHAVYCSDPDDAYSRDVPFLGYAFRALDRYSGDTLDIHFRSGELRPFSRRNGGAWSLHQLLGLDLGIGERAEGDALYVWKRPSTVTSAPRAVPLRLGNLHSEARIGAVARLAAELAAGCELPVAVRRAERQPARLDPEEIKQLLPGSTRRERKAIKQWTEGYRVRHGANPDADIAAQIVAGLGSPNSLERKTARAMITAVLTVSGVLGAPHVLVNDIPDTFERIQQIYEQLVDDG